MANWLGFAKLGFSLLAFGLGSAVAMLGCSEDCPWSEQGLKVDILVGTMPTGWPAPDGPCHTDWGFEPSSLVSGRIVSLQQGKDSGCAAGVLDAPGIGGWNWEIVPYNDPNTYASLLTSYRITRGACAATLTFRLSGRDSAECGTQANAPCALFLRFEPEPGHEADCPALCRQIKLDVTVNRR